MKKIPKFKNYVKEANFGENKDSIAYIHWSRTKKVDGLAKFETIYFSGKYYELV